MSFLSKVKNFVHSITTNDHYASYDDRSGSSRDRQLLNHDYPSHGPGDRYTSGSRSQQLNSASGSAAGSAAGSTVDLSSAGAAAAGGSGIPLGEYPGGTAVPSPEVAWDRIERWLDSHYPELFDQVQDGVTDNDLDELEHDLDCVLPPDVRGSYKIHDGQEPSGKPTGLFYGITFLDLENVLSEWTVWRNTAIRLNDVRRPAPQPSSSTAPGPAPNRQNWTDNQRSVPYEAIQTVYAHPGWIPLAKDLDGNNIAIDLAPGKKGTWGQVILFGREFDTKYVIASSWGSFLHQFVSDLESGAWVIDDDIEDAIFAYRQPNGRLASYFDILRTRVQRANPVQHRSRTPSAAGSGRSTPTLILPGQTTSHPSERLPSKGPVANPTASASATSPRGPETVIKLEPAKVDDITSDLKEVDLDAVEPVAEPQPVAEPVAEPETKTETKAEAKTEASDLVDAADATTEPTESSEAQDEEEAEEAEAEADVQETTEQATKPKSKKNKKRNGKGK